MTNVSVKRFNWLRSPSAWEQGQAWRERQRGLREEFEAANSAASTAFANASVNQVTGMTDIITNVAIARLQKEQAAKSVNTLA